MPEEVTVKIKFTVEIDGQPMTEKELQDIIIEHIGSKIDGVLLPNNDTAIIINKWEKI